MATDQVLSFQQCVEVVEVPRVARRCEHRLDSVLFLVVAAVIAGADGPADIEDFGIAKQDWLEQFVELPSGVPSHDTIGRILSLIKPGQFQQALLMWITQLRADQTHQGPVIVSIDGKTARGSYTDTEKSDAIHMVSAWATEHGITLGQVAVDSKSNEITAIPELLDSIDLRDSIVTVDALGCQKSIAAKIEERQYCIGEIPDSMKSMSAAWKGMKSIGQAINVTTVGGKTSVEVRYYISSRVPKVSEFATSVRSHWGIESMHWVLDVVFGEDSSQSSGWNVAVFIPCYEVLNRGHLIWRELMWQILRTGQAVVQLTLLFTSPSMVSGQ